MNFFTIIRNVAILFFICSTSAWSDNQDHWITTWSAAADQAGPVMQSVTIRQIVRSSAGGVKLRIRLSNIYGTGPVSIAAAHVALHASGSAIKAGTDHAVTFNGMSALKIAKGESALSDPVDMNVAALQELAISLYLPRQSGRSTIHGVGLDNTYIQRGKNDSDAASLPSSKIGTSRYFLTDVDVASSDMAGTIVVLGDSITDGVGSTENTNSRWADVLAVRLQSEPKLASIAVANSGIAGNRLLQNAADPFRGDSVLVRFDRDALSKSGVRWVILQLGMNDIGAASVLGTPLAQASSRQIIDGMKNLIAQAHVKGINIIGTTLMPNAGVEFGTAKHTYFSAAGEIKRQEVNSWIRGAHAFDAVADFDQVMRDPAHPDRLLESYDSGDHLHPNDAGHKAMAEAIALQLFDQPH
jgi:lysophospholipase L1-like esterase